ncbi:MAG: HAD-IA family hydrolase [Thermoleophilia bacterium]|nr:HAD-IA family hydrolase [Thermoleophilia bacterium]
MKRPPTLVFDLGGILVENATLTALSDLLPERPEPEAIRSRWLTSEAVRAFERGRSEPLEFATRFLCEWGLALSPAEFLTEFASWPRDFWPAALELLDELREEHVVACLTNCNVVHWERFDGFSEQFDLAFSSHLLGLIKPDRDIYATLLARLAVPPGEVRYFDDAPECVAAARELGIVAYLADGPDACRRVLELEGVCAPCV